MTTVEQHVDGTVSIVGGDRLTVAEFCARQGVARRTALAWLAAGEVPGARKVAGAWELPASYDRRAWVERAATESQALALVVDDEPAPAGVTPREVLRSLPGLLTADQVAMVLAIPVAQVRANAELFGGLPVGRDGSLRFRHDVIAGFFPA
jgi:hypothetical protein